MSNRQGVDGLGWTKLGPGAEPNSNRDVLVWNTLEFQPHAAFFDSEERMWFCKLDGLPIENGAVSHWMEIQAPEGVFYG
ncbi:hypothetical protein GTP23_12855 [Pseudoduganella sp. FT93W]|uniref:Uncharacterized protein n=1 Tax=Duganella fentianensis TaxID=2692177 RepID=A0A845I4P1_9BURK|nr:hypothetical protein [Duganella fentianensis]MYN45938.1 hypothetical protein [Duganella fentianensis]